MSVLAALASSATASRRCSSASYSRAFNCFIACGAVLVLRAVVLARDDDSGRNVGDPNRTVGGVDVLTARARRAIGIDAQIGFVDLDVDVVVDLGIDPDAGEAGVAPRRAVVGADPDQPVDAAFGLQIAVGIFALDQDRRRLDPRLFARMMVDQIDLHPVALAPARVHPLEHPAQSWLSVPPAPALTST